SLLEFTVPRLWGHYNRDIEHYRKKQDREAAAARDPLKVFAGRLIDAGLMSQAQLEELVAGEEQKVERLAQEVLQLPYPDPGSARQHVVSLPAKSAVESVPAAPVEVKEMTYIEAVNAALRAELESDPRTVIFGED